MAFIIGPLMGLLLFSLRPLALTFYPNFDPETLDLAMLLMRNSSIMLIFQALNFITLMGILRGGGDLRFVLVADVIFLWTVAIPLGLAANYLLGWPPHMVIIAMRADEVLKAMLCLWRVNGDNWVQDLTVRA